MNGDLALVENFVPANEEEKREAEMRRKRIRESFFFRRILAPIFHPTLGLKKNRIKRSSSDLPFYINEQSERKRECLTLYI